MNEIRVVSTSDVEMIPERPNVTLLVYGDHTDPGDNLRAQVTSTVHKQIASRLRIPWRYYERMLEHAPSLLAKNVNTWWLYMPEDRSLHVGALPGLPGLWVIDWKLP